MINVFDAYSIRRLIRIPRPHHLLPCRLAFRQLQVQIQEVAEDVFAGLPAVGLEHQGIEALVELGELAGGFVKVGVVEIR